MITWMEHRRKILVSDLQRKLTSSVGVKLFILFFICITLFVSAAGYASYQVERSMLERQVASASKQMIIQAREKLDMLFGSFETFSFQFAVDRDLQSEIKTYLGSAAGTSARTSQWEALKTRMEDVLFRDSSLDGIKLYGPDAKEIVLTGNNSRSLQQGSSSAADTAWYGLLKTDDQSVVWIQPKELSADAASLGLARTIKDPLTKQTIAYVVMEIKKDVFINQLDSIQLGTTGVNRLIDRQHETVFATGALQGADDTANYADLLKGAQNSTEKAGAYVLTSGQAGGQLVVYDQLSDERLGWTVVSTISMNELLKGASYVLNVILLIVAAAAIAAGGLGFYVAGFIGKPLRVLKDKMRQGTEGDLSIRVHFGRSDEIGAVGESFNLMMQLIQKLADEANKSAGDVLTLADTVRSGAKETTSSAHNNAESTSQIAEATKLLTKEAERASEMSQAVLEQTEQVIHVSRKIDESASWVKQASKEGKQYMEEVVANNRTVEQVTDSLQGRVMRLAESTNAVSQIVKLLKQMTGQTNVLALNAAIEAARSGVHGKGFMVIASEIRKLSEEANRSIEQVGRIATQIQTDMEETMSAIDESRPVFLRQFEAVRHADQRFGVVHDQMITLNDYLENVDSAIENLRHSQDVLSKAMINVCAISEETSASALAVSEETASQLHISGKLSGTAEQLKEMSSGLKESLGYFQRSGSMTS